MSQAQEQVDVRDCKDAEEAAKMVRDRVRGISAEMGQKSSLEVNLRQESDKWVLYWEAGPEGWAIRLSGEEPVWAVAEPQVVGFYDTDKFWAECKNSFALEFGDY